MKAKKLGDHVCPFREEEGKACTVKELFDGRDEEASLSMFYKKAPKAKGDEDPNMGADYIFIGPDEEEEFAALIGVKLFEDQTNEEKPVAELSSEQLSLHKENIAIIREGLEAIGVAVAKHSDA